jgi:hypothetical protein
MNNNEYYSNTAARLDTIIGDSKIIWLQIISAKREFDTYDQPQTDFYYWLNQTYGVKLKLTPNGEMNLENDITDEQKYLLFMLKHSK